MSQEHQTHLNDRQLAKAEHSKLMDVHTSLLSMQAGFGLAAIRAPGVAAVAGIAALLAFATGNNELYQIPAALSSFNSALAQFFAGVLLSAAAPAVSWVSQASYNSSTVAKKATWVYPYHEDTNASRLWRKLGYTFHFLAILVVILALVALVSGAFHFYNVAISVAGHLSK